MPSEQPSIQATERVDNQVLDQQNTFTNKRRSDRAPEHSSAELTNDPERPIAGAAERLHNSAPELASAGATERRSGKAH